MKQLFTLVALMLAYILMPVSCTHDPTGGKNTPPVVTPPVPPDHTETPAPNPTPAESAFIEPLTLEKPVIYKGFSYLDVAGFNLGISDDIAGQASAETSLQQLKKDIQTVAETVRQPILDYLRSKTILVLNGNTDIIYDESGEYKGSIVIGNVINYEAAVTTNQPMLLLNRMALQVTEILNDKAKQTLTSTYNESVSKYSEVYYSNGIKYEKIKKAADATRDERAYLAELSESYLGENDYYPIDIKELERFDPKGFDLMKWIWGKKDIPANKDGITLPPPELKEWTEKTPTPLSEFYSKYLTSEGIPIIGSRFVHDEAFVQAAKVVKHMLTRVPEAAEGMLLQNFRMVIVGKEEGISDIPDCAIYYVWYPGMDWDERGRGFGPNDRAPVMTCGEENIIFFDRFIERYHSESIIVHEFGHCIDFGLRVTRPEFFKKLQSAYDSLEERGLWTGTYAATTIDEYWAVGTQMWYNAGYIIAPGYGTMRLRDQLKQYDIVLYNLLAEIYPEEMTLTGYHFTYDLYFLGGCGDPFEW